MLEVIGSPCSNKSAQQAQSSGTSVPQPDEFDGDDDKWLGWWFGVKNLNNAVLSNVDKKYAPEDGESKTAVQDGEDELNKDPVAENDEIDTVFHELQSGERMADTVKRGVLLKCLAPIAEVQQYVMKDPARLIFFSQMRAEVVNLLRA